MNRVQEAGDGSDCRNVRLPGSRVRRGFLGEIGNLIEVVSMTAGRDWKALSAAQRNQFGTHVGAKAGG